MATRRKSENYTTQLTVHNARFLGYISSADAPTTATLPQSLDFAIYNHVGTALYLAVNIAGVIKTATIA